MGTKWERRGEMIRVARCYRGMSAKQSRGRKKERTAPSERKGRG